MSKTVLVTGCDRGIGLGLVKHYLKEGYKVCATCLNPDSATDLKQVLTDSNAECKDPIKLDVRDEKSISQAFDEVKKCCPSLDILINNAGISTPNHPEDKALMITRNDMLHVYETDVVGALLVTKQFIPMLRDSNEKKIINISSNMGSLTLNAPNNPVGVWVGNTTSYRCAKAALNMATRNLAYELPEFVVVAMHPGWVDTEMGTSKGEVQAPLSVDESAQHLIATIARLTPEDSSGFKNYDGKDIPWEASSPTKIPPSKRESTDKPNDDPPPQGPQNPYPNPRRAPVKDEGGQQWQDQNQLDTPLPDTDTPWKPVPEVAGDNEDLQRSSPFSENVTEHVDPQQKPPKPPTFEQRRHMSSYRPGDATPMPPVHPPIPNDPTSPLVVEPTHPPPAEPPEIPASPYTHPEIPGLEAEKEVRYDSPEIPPPTKDPVDQAQGAQRDSWGKKDEPVPNPTSGETLVPPGPWP